MLTKSPRFLRNPSTLATVIAGGSALVAAGLLALAPVTAAGPVTMKIDLHGADEVPGPGSEKGIGHATVTPDPSKGQICYTLIQNGLDTPTMAHIHKGAKGVAGPVVVPLDPPVHGSSQACAAVAPDLLKAIIGAPADYYVNIHTANFPKGAVRGQLGGQ